MRFSSNGCNRAVWVEESPSTGRLNGNLHVLPYCLFIWLTLAWNARAISSEAVETKSLSEVHVKELCLSESVHQRLFDGALLGCQTGKLFIYVHTCRMQRAVTSNKPWGNLFLCGWQQSETDIYESLVSFMQQHYQHYRGFCFVYTVCSVYILLEQKPGSYTILYNNIITIYFAVLQR